MMTGRIEESLQADLAEIDAAREADIVAEYEFDCQQADPFRAVCLGHNWPGDCQETLQDLPF